MSYFSKSKVNVKKTTQINSMELIFESMLTLNLLQVFTLKMANKIKEEKVWDFIILKINESNLGNVLLYCIIFAFYMTGSQTMTFSQLIQLKKQLQALQLEKDRNFGGKCKSLKKKDAKGFLQMT